MGMNGGGNSADIMANYTLDKFYKSKGYIGGQAEFDMMLATSDMDEKKQKAQMDMWKAMRDGKTAESNHVATLQKNDNDRQMGIMKLQGESRKQEGELAKRYDDAESAKLSRSAERTNLGITIDKHETELSMADRKQTMQENKDAHTANKELDASTLAWRNADDKRSLDIAKIQVDKEKAKSTPGLGNKSSTSNTSNTGVA